ncbi:hypothetical protein FACS1894166_04790 [Bacilli bacterium]|nr:hypothetical protein FACS1894166_04790 [Bacilli bacterium]
MEGITSNETINKYVKNAVDELKNKTQLMQAKTSDNKVTALIRQMEFDYSLSTLEQLKKLYSELDKVFNIVMYESQKTNAVNELNKIKSMTKKLSASKNICYFVVQDIEPKTLSKALSEIINADKEHAYIALNNFNGKLQYIILASQVFTLKTSFNAHQIIQQINKLSDGSGGGRNEFAQGGTINTRAESAILDFIAKL